jgi:hypothetical protein
LNKPDSVPRQPKEGTRAYLMGRGTELVERLLEIEEEIEARRMIAAIVAEDRPLYRFLLRCWREGRVIF